MIGILNAPSNLGLRPPQPGSVPGCLKGPEALREAGLHARLMQSGALEAGVVLPGRYVEETDPPANRLRNQEAIVDHARRLADRMEELLAAELWPLVLGGDCSLLVGTTLALARRGRHGLVHLDGHTDFRHPGNSRACRSLAGEDLAAAVGLHWPVVSDIDRLRPYIHAADVAQVGCRDADEYLLETRAILGAVIPASEVRGQGADAAVARIAGVVAAQHLVGYWIHLDVDVLDPSCMPAVDSPDAGGLQPDELVALLRGLAPNAVGVQVTVFDPDLDPTGRHAQLLADTLEAGLATLNAGHT